MKIQEDCFEINEIDNLIDNLEMVAHSLESPIRFKWKWGIIALHQALYGALISVLQGTDSRQTVIDRQQNSGKAVMLHVQGVQLEIIASVFGKNEETIKDWICNPRLIDINEALNRVKETKYLPPYGERKPLKTSKEENDAIEKLTSEFRNGFEHFRPQHWLVFTDGMPPLFSHVLRVIQFLIFESNCVITSAEQEKMLKTALTNIERLLNSQNNS